MKKLLYTHTLFILTIISGAEKEFRPQIEKVITSQFNAFKRRTYTLPTIALKLKGMFGKMVKIDILISDSEVIHSKIKLKGQINFR